MIRFSLQAFKNELIRKLKTSEFLAELRQVNLIQKQIDTGRTLTAAEINLLQQQGNNCRDWKLIRVHPEFSTENIYHNFFRGKCYLGRVTKGNESIAHGWINNTISNCVISENVQLENNGLLQNMILLQNAVVINNRQISADNPKFAVGHRIHVGMETGERQIELCPELDIPIANEMISQCQNKSYLEAYSNFLADFKNKMHLTYGVIGRNARVQNNTSIHNSYFGSCAKIDSTNTIENVLVLSDPADPVHLSGGVFIKNAILQWGCVLNSLAIVEDAFLSEHCHVERHAKISQAIVGPNSHIGAGEITSCLLGPFTAAHHQSLLIAAIWPEGKGNIGYGANVGSNHTSKAPDQEIACGEGVFYGLGANIKFPSNFSEAPYSIIATAVNTLPQRVKFPFSLINQPSEFPSGISPAFNEIFPGWVLSDNVYAVIRNEGKYKKRNKAKRSRFETDVLRPEIIELLLNAWETLSAADDSAEIYTERQIDGIGKNFMRKASLQKAKSTYRFFLEYYALRELKNQVSDLPKLKAEASIEEMISQKSAYAPMNLAATLLEKFNLKKMKTADWLSKLKEMQQLIFQQVLQAKQRDDKRGRKIFDDYDDNNTLAADNAFVKEYAAFTKQFCREIDDMLSKKSRNNS